MDRRRTGVARGRAEHGQAFAGLFDLALVEQAQQLQREVLEGQRRAVKQLQHIGLVRDLLQRGHIRRIKTPIRLRRELMPLRVTDLRREQREKLRRKLRIRQLRPSRQLVGDARQRFG